MHNRGPVSSASVKLGSYNGQLTQTRWHQSVCVIIVAKYMRITCIKPLIMRTGLDFFPSPSTALSYELRHTVYVMCKLLSKYSQDTLCNRNIGRSPDQCVTSNGMMMMILFKRCYDSNNAKSPELEVYNLQQDGTSLQCCRNSNGAMTSCHTDCLLTNLLCKCITH